MIIISLIILNDIVVFNVFIKVLMTEGIIIPAVLFGESLLHRIVFGFLLKNGEKILTLSVCLSIFLAGSLIVTVNE